MKLSENLIKIVALSVLILLFAGCNMAGYLRNKHMGKYLPTNVDVLDKDGQGVQNDENFTIAYSYSVNAETQMMHIDGSIKYNKTCDESQYHSETVLLHVEMFEVRVAFTDADGKINGFEVFYINPGKNIFDTLSFEEELPFQDGYKYMHLGYNVLYKGT
ncbi:MAG: hypothetical protein MI863_24585 [Desulfobacterales bacterium]|nr:hypothetical protein [Desulfobacterales bacterium]